MFLTVVGGIACGCGDLNLTNNLIAEQSALPVANCARAPIRSSAAIGLLPQIARYPVYLPN
jgi:hypothetical protein